MLGGGLEVVWEEREVTSFGSGWSVALPWVFDVVSVVRRGHARSRFVVSGAASRVIEKG